MPRTRTASLFGRLLVLIFLGTSIGCPTAEEPEKQPTTETSRNDLLPISGDSDRVGNLAPASDYAGLQPPPIPQPSADLDLQLPSFPTEPLALPADEAISSQPIAPEDTTPQHINPERDRAPSLLPSPESPSPGENHTTDGVSTANPAPLARPQELQPDTDMATDEAPSEMSLRLAATNNPTAISGPAVISVAAGGKGKGEPFDPIKVNGPIFEGWPEKPRVAIVITGRQDGYMEPCGCAGLDRMKGGMSRRHTLFKQLREKGWPVLAVDVGGVAKGFGLQAEFKFHRMIDGMRSMGYDAIAMGKSDLTLPAEELASVAASTPNFPSPFVSANTALFGFDAELTARTRVVERGGIRFGITSVLGKKYQQQVRNDEVEMMDPTVALRQKQLVSELREGKVDYPILLAHATIEESVALAEQFPFFRLVVTAGGPPEPPDRPRVLNKGKTLLIEVGQKGMDAIVIALHEEGTKRQLLYERVPLDSRFPGSEEMQVLMQTYQSQLKEAGFAGLGLRPVPHPQKKTHGKYVGSKKCGECHEDSYLIWKQSGHAKAFRTLTDMDPPRQFDPQCVSCHTMGWHTTSFFPYDTGYQSAEATPKLINVGCESCHGPGEMHVKAENGSDMDLQTQAQKLMVVTREESEARACYECHDLDNSPAFDFKTYWPKIEHAEED